MAQLDKSALSNNIDGVHTASQTSSYWGNTTNGGITGATHAGVLNLLIAQLQNLLDSTVNLLDDVISQADAEAGTATTPKLWTAERVAQAIAALGITNPLGTDLDLGGNDLLNVGNSLEIGGADVPLTAGALVPLDLKLFGSGYGTHASPATSGGLSIASSEGTPAWAEILYQAASAPSVTGISDYFSPNWDAVNINVLHVYHHFDGTYIATHKGVR